VLRLVPTAALLLACGACLFGADDRTGATRKARHHYKLGHGHYAEGQQAQALTELFEALKHDPDHVDTHHLLGIVFMARREFYQAVKHLERVVALRPDLLEARNNLGVAYLALCRWAEATELYSELVRRPLYSTPWVAHNNLGWALWQTEQRAEAIRHFRKSVFFNPKFCVAFNNLGLAYLDEHRYEEAERALRKALSAAPTCASTYAEPHLHLARLHERRGQGQQACRELVICLNKAPPGEEQVGAGCGQSPVGQRCERKARRVGCAVPG